MVKEFVVGKSYRLKDPRTRHSVFNSSMDILKEGGTHRCLYIILSQSSNSADISFEGIPGGLWTYHEEDFKYFEEVVSFISHKSDRRRKIKLKQEF